LKSSTWERLRGTHMEKTGSNRSNMGVEGTRADNNCGQSAKPKRSRLKSKSRKALERTQSPRFDMVKGAGSAAKRATLQLSAQSGEGLLNLFSVSTQNKRQHQPETCQVKHLLSTVVCKDPHQQVQEADLGDWQKELVVKSVVPWNCRELREFLKQTNHYHCFLKDCTAVIKPVTLLATPKVK